MAGRITPEKITELSMCEVFVFGSNLKGHHNGGAARMAHSRFGAEWGVGVGPTGKCYAIPTMHGGVEDIKPYVDDFVEYVRNHPDNRFLVTRIGCGIAGFTDREIAPLFKDVKDTPNVCLPKEWLFILDEDEMLDVFCTGIIPEEPEVKIPEALDENDLMRLCDEYKYVIGARIIAAPKPKIRIRYVIDRDRFGYADFGDFFFIETGDLYVWTYNKEFADDHNQDMVEGYFGDECKGRGYCHRVIFAGVETGYRDSNGDKIYTGDVLELYGESSYGTFALGTLGENMEDRNAIYAFVLDNHCITPEMCKTMTRVGTVFYQLDWNEEPWKIVELCDRFQPWRPSDETEEDRLMMAKYTPNFDQEIWKYYANDVLGIEFNWR
ncbi:A1S_2505 family phage non-structural protein [Duncaniella muricolitica]|jgi:hypothetical protein|uniref:A1S_2505 family phage non-structural protein n=1 Tax=Duncaniella muricolitica TaxID=2880704 RepID=UPI003137968E